MNLKARLETPEDYFQVEALVRRAFFDVFKPGCDEHYLVHCLRKHQDYVQELDYVATVNGQIIGHIMYSHGTIVCDDGETLPVLTLAPLAIDPCYQKQGVGSFLVTETLEKARQLGYQAVLLCGWEDYYPRFGFVEAAQFGICDENGKSYPALQALPLQKDVLKSGRYYYSDVFYQLDEKKVQDFDIRFQDASFEEDKVLLGK